MWEYPYHVIECVGGHLPVYKMQLVGKTTRFRVLHRNLLFPHTMINESDEKQQDMEEEEPKLTNLEEENHASSVEQVDNNKGPITRSRTERMENALLLKANTLMSNHFND